MPMRTLGSIRRTKAAHDKLIRLKDFKVGDSVLLFNSKSRLFPGKLRSKWSGPFKIHEVLPMDPSLYSTKRGRNSHLARNSFWRRKTEQLDRAKSRKLDRAERVDGVLLMAVSHLQTTTLPPSSLGGTEAKFGGANSSSIELGLLEHLEHWDVRSKEGLGAWTQLNWNAKEKKEAILKTSSTIYSTNRSSSSTRPAKLQLDRAEKSKSNPKNVASPLTSL
ncbi:unnamed protein product [Microthlaspi erraticum]|uniref:Uncharacterized protein n=1 Tax=Microthlaspi erraticum TaxID=1685480 RepID=A0A6D2I648_9BRAS|nr:unnamed protein product [Microthlaspi erraticum]